MTSDAALDLSHSGVGGFTIASSNAIGTNFIMRDFESAVHVVGGSGSDTITLPNSSLEVWQRNYLFGATSVEKIVDLYGTYVNFAPTITSNGGGNTAACQLPRTPLR